MWGIFRLAKLSLGWVGNFIFRGRGSVLGEDFGKEFGLCLGVYLSAEEAQGECTV